MSVITAEFARVEETIELALELAGNRYEMYKINHSSNCADVAGLRRTVPSFKAKRPRRHPGPLAPWGWIRNLIGQRLASQSFSVEHLEPSTRER